MRRKAVTQQSVQPVKQAPAPVGAVKRPAAPNSAVLDMMQQNMSAEDAVMTGIDSLPSTQVAPPQELSDKILGRLGIPADSMKIYKDSGLSDLGQSAYARGGEIHISDELYAPGTKFGEHLIMHEAAHVLQSGLGKVGGSGLLDDSGLESQAEALSTGGIENAGLDISGFSAPTGADAPMLGWNPFKSIKNYFANRKRNKEDPVVSHDAEGHEVRVSDLAMQYRGQGDEAFQALMTDYAPDIQQGQQVPPTAAESKNLGGLVRLGTGMSIGTVGLVNSAGMVMTKFGSGIEGVAKAGATMSKLPFQALGTAALGAVGSGLGIYQTAQGMAHGIKTGAKTDAAAQGVSLLGNTSAFAKSGMALTLGGLGAAGIAAPAVLSSAVLPGLGIASGALQATSGAIQLASAGVHRAKLNKLMGRTGDNGEQYLNDSDQMTARQLKGKTTKDMISGAWDVGTGAVSAAGGVASLFTAGIGSAVSAVGSMVGAIGKFIHGKIADKRHVKNTVEEAVGLSAQIANVKQTYHVNDSVAEKIVLRAMGCSSQMELFNRITAKRAIDLQERAMGGDVKAQEMLEASGLSTVKPGNAQMGENGKFYSLQGIAEKLGGKGAGLKQQLGAMLEARHAARPGGNQDVPQAITEPQQDVPPLVPHLNAPPAPRLDAPPVPQLVQQEQQIAPIINDYAPIVRRRTQSMSLPVRPQDITDMPTGANQSLKRRKFAEV